MLIVGLGNPDKKYDGTYHNVGFMVIDKLLEKLGINLKEEACRAKFASFYKNGEKVIIAKPMTYMNLSGEAVIALSSRFKIPANEIIVVYDDIDLPVGEIRIRKSGSAGTHNGMRNIVSKLGGTESIDNKNNQILSSYFAICSKKLQKNKIFANNPSKIDIIAKSLKI